MITVTLIIVVLVAFNALYVAAEFATVSVKTIRIQALAETGNKAAQRLLPHLSDASSLDRYVAACQIGITASSLVLGAFGQKALAKSIEPWIQRTGSLDPATAASITATVILILLTAFQVVLGELLPKAVALRIPERTAIALTYPMLASLWLFKWFIAVLNGTGTWFLKLMGVPTAGHRHVHSPEELERLVGHDETSVTLEATERKLMMRVFHFADHSGEQIMVPRAAVTFLDAKAPLEDSLKLMRESGHTRFPVLDSQTDQIAGYIHLKDVTRAVARGRLKSLEPLLRPALHATADLSATDLFERMRREGSHLVMLSDDSGAMIGLVTMEDILQQVVGKMQDEFSARTENG
jgi:CBS domain containing-hemolysin-like protein